MGSIDTSAIAKEKISVLVDGELSSTEMDKVLSSLYDSQEKDTWELYHRIGDVLRSDEMDVPLSADFSKKMHNLLENEPLIMVPSHKKLQGKFGGHLQHKSIKKFIVSGMAAVAAVAFVVINVNQKDIVQDDNSIVASSGSAATHSTAGNLALVSDNQDSTLDDYMLAHRRFSPSFYGAAQYVRLPVTATGSDD